MSDVKTYCLFIKDEARRLGFLDCGITTAVPFHKASELLSEWLMKGYHGDMNYMKNQFHIKTDPRKFLKGAKSVIITLQNYYTSEKQKDPSAPVISRYAFGQDHHKVIRKKLKKLLDFIRKEINPCEGRIFVDSGAVSEKTLACRAGLGWIGKNSLLLSRKYGSFFFIGGIVTDLELGYDQPVKDYCGVCVKCMDSCPADAIVRPGFVDARKCLAYLTIETKVSNLPAGFRGKFRNRVFGCDICQDVCPWNKNVTPHQEPGFRPNPILLEMTRDEWYNLDERKFNEIFKGSALKRLKYNRLRRNLEFLKSYHSGFDSKSSPE